MRSAGSAQNENPTPGGHSHASTLYFVVQPYSCFCSCGMPLASYASPARLRSSSRNWPKPRKPVLKEEPPGPPEQ